MLLIHQARPQSVMEVRPKLSAPIMLPALPLAMMGTAKKDCMQTRTAADIAHHQQL
jgi:hypothetical protein